MQSISFENPWQYETMITESPTNSLTPHGMIEIYEFPSTADKDSFANWNIDVHNVGTDGRIAFGIANILGNPGNLVVSWGTEETTIIPNQYWRVHTINPVANCFHLVTNGRIKFTAGGAYTIKLWGMWFDETDQLWHYNPAEEITIQVTVQDPWPVSIPIHIFDKILLKGGWGEGSAKSAPIANVSTDILLGAKIEYSITWEKSGVLGVVDAYIEWNGYKLLTQHWGVGEVGSVTTGSIDITGRVLTTNNIVVGFEQGLAEFCEVRFDIWVTFGFSEDPPEPPQVPTNWWDIIDKYKLWIALGGIGIVALYMFKKPSIIVVGGSK